MEVTRVFAELSGDDVHGFVEFKEYPKPVYVMRRSVCWPNFSSQEHLAAVQRRVEDWRRGRLPRLELFSENLLRAMLAHKFFCFDHTTIRGKELLGAITRTAEGLTTTHPRSSTGAEVAQWFPPHKRDATAKQINLWVDQGLVRSVGVGSVWYRRGDVALLLLKPSGPLKESGIGLFGAIVEKHEGTWRYAEATTDHGPITSRYDLNRAVTNIDQLAASTWGNYPDYE